MARPRNLSHILAARNKELQKKRNQELINEALTARERRANAINVSTQTNYLITTKTESTETEKQTIKQHHLTPKTLKDDFSDKTPHQKTSEHNIINKPMKHKSHKPTKDKLDYKLTKRKSHKQPKSKHDKLSNKRKHHTKDNKDDTQNKNKVRKNNTSSQTCTVPIKSTSSQTLNQIIDLQDIHDEGLF